jgi:septum formation protein
MQKIILASSSPQRKNLFSVLNIPFEVIPADIDETSIRDNIFEKQAEKIARAKAEKVASENTGIVISADTFVVLNNQILEKPKNLEEAKKMLELQSGKEEIVYTGLCYLDAENKINFSTTSIINIKFRELSEREIENYIKKFPVTSWSAAFSPAYPYGITLINEINGSFTGFTYGLPLDLIIPLLKKSGFDIRP